MSVLEILAKETHDAKGLEHIQHLRVLRNYIAISTEEALIEAINHINDTEVLRTLVETGLHKKLLEVVTIRYDDITKRMAGVR